MSYNFKEALKGLNNTQYIEEDAEKVLKLVVEKAKEARISDIRALVFCLGFDNNKYYINTILHYGEEQLELTEPLVLLNRSYASGVIYRIRDILNEQEFEWKVMTQEMNEIITKKEKKHRKFIECYGAFL